MTKNEMSAAERARWLAELAQAIEEAQRIALRLGRARGTSGEARELHAQLETARAEVEALRRGGWRSQEVDLPPKWLQSLVDSATNAGGLGERSGQTPCGRSPPPAKS